MKNKSNIKLLAFILAGCLIVSVALVAPVIASETSIANPDGFIGTGFGQSGFCNGYCQLDRQLKEGKITPNQYNGMKKVQTKIDSLRNQMQGTWLKGLCDNNIIGQEQYEQILEVKAQRNTLRESVSNLTPEERQAKMAEDKAARLKSLLENGTITQEQYDQMMSPNGASVNGKHHSGKTAGGSHHSGNTAGGKHLSQCWR